MTIKQMESGLKEVYMSAEAVYNDENFIDTYGGSQLYNKLTDVMVLLGSIICEMREENA